MLVIGPRQDSQGIVVRAPANDVTGVFKGAPLTRAEKQAYQMRLTKWISAHCGLPMGLSLIKRSPGTFSSMKETRDILTHEES